MKKTLPKQSNQLPLIFRIFRKFRSIATAAATSYQPVFEESIQFEISATQKLPATIKFLRLSATSYQPVFEEHIYFKICASSKATSYH